MASSSFHVELAQAQRGTIDVSDAVHWLELLSMPPMQLAPCLCLNSCKAAQGSTWTAQPCVQVNLPGRVAAATTYELADLLIAILQLLAVDASRHTLVRRPRLGEWWSRCCSAASRRSSRSLPLRASLSPLSPLRPPAPPRHPPSIRLRMPPFAQPVRLALCYS